MSDLMVDFGLPPPREVRARPYVYQQAVLSSTIPIHASISVETTHTRVPQPQAQPSNTSAPTAPTAPTAPPPTPAAQQQAQQPVPQAPRLPTTSPTFVRHITRPSAQPNQAASTTGTATPQTASQTFHGWRATNPTGPNAHRPPTVHMLHPGGPHPFSRLPVAAMAAPGGWTPVNLGGHMAPMVYMEVRSNNQADDQQTGQSPTSLGEFDDFLPCHSRHLSRSSRGEGSRPRPTVTPAAAATAAFASPLGPTDGQARQGEAPAAGIPSVNEFMNEMFRQVLDLKKFY